MSNIMIERLKNSIGKEIKVYLHNGFKYAGELKAVDNENIEILDHKLNAYKIIRIETIRDLEVQNDGN